MVYRPTKLSPPEVAKKYAPAVASSVTVIRWLLLFLGFILVVVGMDRFDEEIIIYVAIIEVILQLIVSLNYALACLFFRVAVDKGYTAQVYLAAAFWLGAVGYLLVVALPNTYANVSVEQVPAQPVQTAQPIQQTPPVQQAQTPPAATVAPASGQIGRCVQCGATDVPLHNVSVNISGVQRTRAVCADCAAKYNQ